MNKLLLVTLLLVAAYSLKVGSLACCPETYIYDQDTLRCVCPLYAPFVTNSGKCVACNAPSRWDNEAKICLKCRADQSEDANGDCVCSRPNPYDDGKACVPCPDDLPIWNGKKCVACPPNTHYDVGSKTCTVCPEGLVYVPEHRLCEVQA